MKQVSDMSLPELIDAAKKRAKRERRDYDATIADMLERLCAEVEAKGKAERQHITARLDTAAKMRRGEAL
jgi:F0F1-type ATP synthase membrane subunit b/b'